MNASWNTVTPLFLKQLKQRLVDVACFRLSKTLHTLSVLIKYANCLVVFPYLLGRRFYEAKFPTQGFFPFYIYRITLNFSSTLKTFSSSSL